MTKQPAANRNQSDKKRRRLVATLDRRLARMPERPLEELKAELEELWPARRRGGRRTPTE